MGLVEDYSNSLRSANYRVIREYPTEYYPKLTNEDYQRGYFIRYFIKLKTNKNNTITELDGAAYKKYSADTYILAQSLFQLTSLRWKIIGSREDVIMGNTNTVNAKDASMKNISMRLNNRLQFWKSS